MAKKTLIETNPYLKDPEKRKAMFYATVASSTAIEGVHAAVKKALKAVEESNKTSNLSGSAASGRLRRKKSSP